VRGCAHVRGGAHGLDALPGTDACKGLARLDLPAAKVESAEAEAAGALTPPADLPPWMVGYPSFYNTLATFCRVVVRASPSADSDIQIEAWLPLAGWNGRFRRRGNGGFAGQIDSRSMAAALSQGYATTGTNTDRSAAIRPRAYLRPRIVLSLRYPPGSHLT
jgi:feruloyl esterase